MRDLYLEMISMSRLVHGCLVVFEVRSIWIEEDRWMGWGLFGLFIEAVDRYWDWSDRRDYILPSYIIQFFSSFYIYV